MSLYHTHYVLSIYLQHLPLPPCTKPLSFFSLWFHTITRTPSSYYWVKYVTLLHRARLIYSLCSLLQAQQLQQYPNPTIPVFTLGVYLSVSPFALTMGYGDQLPNNSNRNISPYFLIKRRDNNTLLTCSWTHCGLCVRYQHLSPTRHYRIPYDILRHDMTCACMQFQLYPNP